MIGEHITILKRWFWHAENNLGFSILEIISTKDKMLGIFYLFLRNKFFVVFVVKFLILFLYFLY